MAFTRSTLRRIDEEPSSSRGIIDPNAEILNPTQETPPPSTNLGADPPPFAQDQGSQPLGIEVPSSTLLTANSGPVILIHESRVPPCKSVSPLGFSTQQPRYLSLPDIQASDLGHIKELISLLHRIPEGQPNDQIHHTSLVLDP